MSTVDKMYALKTICGAILYTLKRYNQREVSEYDWDFLSYYINVEKGAVHCVELTARGFILQTRNLSLQYVHHDNYANRLVTIF